MPVAHFLLSHFVPRSCSQALTTQTVEDLKQDAYHVPTDRDILM